MELDLKAVPISKDILNIGCSESSDYYHFIISIPFLFLLVSLS